MIALGMLAIIGLGACASTPRFAPIASDPAPPSVMVVTADWDDLEAAASVAASQTESVVVGATESPDRLIFELVSIREEPVVLTARRVEPARAGPERIELTCAVGRLGDATLQRRFLGAMSRRLADLRGVDYRKVR